MSDADAPEQQRESEEFMVAMADPDLSLDSLAEGRALKTHFIANFGSWFESEVRPLLRRVHAAGGEPQMLVNDLAAFMATIADSIVFPLADEDDDEGEPADGDAAPG